MAPSDAAVSDLLEPVAHRAGQLVEQNRPEQALCTFPAELIAFPSAHRAISRRFDDLDLPARDCAPHLRSCHRCIGMLFVKEAGRPTVG
ncbi:hypothetical protein ACIRP2_20050 [Streptomyces sp. NPDC101194]|uniref:hypothetical protein n=1 Tax=Streptomyces sp. NPDC101194 TaxID=3366127 RepID=UPI003810CC36